MSIANKISGKLRHYSLNNPVMNAFFKQKRQVFLTAEFLGSEDYVTLFTHKVADKAGFLKFIDDAEQETANYQYRHQYWNRSLGSWRWKGVFQHRVLLIDTIFDMDKVGVDFGGAYGPIAKHTRIVDFNEKDLFGRKVSTKSLEQLEDHSIDYLFSSHTLEHIKELEKIVVQIKQKVKPGGDILLNLPSFSCKRWNSGLHKNRLFNDHQWTFYLKDEVLAPTEDLQNLLAIDDFLAAHFTILIKSYTGDNSIFLHLKNEQ